MRSSRQSSVLSAVEKLKYPHCDRKKQHAKESLNFICLSSNCKSRGLICLQCKSSEHSGHNIQPVRTFLSKLEESLKRLELDRGPKMEQNPSVIKCNERTMVEKLQEQHLEMLSLLKLQIEEVAERVRICEEQVIKEFNRAKERISTEYEKQTIINKTLAEIQRYFSESEASEGLDLKFSINKLLALLKIQKNDISVTNDAEIQLNSYILAGKTFKNNILVWERETNNIIGDVFKTKPEYQVKEGPNRPTTAVDSTGKPVALTFSPQLKTESIVLQKDNKIAKVKDDKNGKVLLLNHPVVEAKSGPIKFKVVSLSAASILHVGVCLKPLLAQKQFKFEKSNAAHGMFLASSNGFLYSSADVALNNTKGAVTFKTGDEISLQIDAKQNKMIVKKKNDTKSAELSLKHIAETDWKQLHYCVSMGNIGDKVQLLG